MSIFFFFQPEKIEQKDFGDVPLLHIKNFTMYELDPTKVETLMMGKEAFRYQDKYVVDEIDHTDNAKTHISNLKAKFGVYKDDMLTLDGNVTLVRDDGLNYHTQTAFYNKKNGSFVTDSGYVLSQGKNFLRGTYLDHNSLTGKIHSKNIEAKYYLNEGK